MIVPSTRHLVPADGLDLVEAAALTDAALTPYRAVKKVLPSLVPGSSVLVIGAGGLGQHALQFLQLLTQASIIVVETAQDKREFVASLGVEAVIDGNAGDVLDQVRTAAGEGGVEAALDFVGVDATISLAQHALSREGIFVLVGLAGGGTRFSFFDMAAEAVMTTSTWGSRNELVEVLALARDGKIHTVLERHPLEEANEALERLHKGEVQGRAVLIP
ncbi:zinc-binding dehydrogenase [Microbacterium sp. NPDC080220]|uniref:zinc-binding dehydrogenase n=1 Tax=Microbacterium sp. NPDC080220 TaxID=3161017 RepID=UPI003436EFE8